jgi:hypothetical protein
MKTRSHYALAGTIQSGEEEINAKTQRRKGAKRPSRNQIFLDCGGKRSATLLWKLGPQSKSGVAAALCHRSPRSSRGRSVSKPFFLCAFAPLRLCVETSLNTYGLGQRAFSDLPTPLIADF